ncbi:TniQ family protein [Colwellia psychrerythraea]|uniref:TniQ domain-containing protein n=1 Tax=Colwellia psychrerythraea TaxID=28229 RepID=A0A099KCL4_COLPS|nr:TniQ family protein [Colwellia psychrerythraea]KGJ87328.1 hypothetical protein ND2E_0735 [Colwellia psychrerythraea]
MNNNVELPYLFPNEHLLSVLARWFDLTGRNDFLMTCKKVSSNLTKLTPSAVWRPVFRDLASHYKETMPLEVILKEHTLLPYYRSFLTSTELGLFNDELLKSGESFKLLPKLQQNLKHAHYWRWCKQCAHDDYQEYGTTYWHTNHQVPTLLKCYKHGCALQTTCADCGFNFQTFQRFWLPPHDGFCPACNSVWVAKELPTSVLINWIESISLYLQQNTSAVPVESLIGLMKRHFGFDSFPRNLPLSLRKDVTNMQLDFNQWLNDGVIEAYFNRDKLSILKPNQKLLNIVTTVFRGNKVPPISLLLMLKSLGLEHEFLKLVMGDEPDE